MRTMLKINQLGTLEKIVVTGGVLIGAAAIVGAGAFAVFTATGKATVGADAGQVKVALNTSITVENMAPGDVVYRELPIVLPKTQNAGNLVNELGVFIAPGQTDTFGQDPEESGGTVRRASLFDTGAIDTGIVLEDRPHGYGLTFQIKTCSVEWTAGTTTTPPTCSAPVTAVGTANKEKLGSILGYSNMVQYAPADFGLTATGPNSDLFPTDRSTDLPLYSMIIFTLPADANNFYQNASVSFGLTVAALQRSATTN